MKNLIDEKLKEIQDLCELTEEKYKIKPKGFLVDNYLRIQDDINSYNIIITPKSIKLSEIINKLKDIFKDLCSITCKRIFPIFTYIYCEDDIIITIDKEKNIILNIEFTNTFIELKWLFTLWITGTEIIDDLKECDE